MRESYSLIVEVLNLSIIGKSIAGLYYESALEMDKT